MNSLSTTIRPVAHVNPAGHVSNRGAPSARPCPVQNAWQRLRPATVARTGLIEQCEEQMLGVKLRVAIALDDFVGAGEGVLCSFGEPLKAHHKMCLISKNNYNLCAKRCQ